MTNPQDHSAPKAAPIVAVPLKPLPLIIFSSRWMQLPLYLGLINVVMISSFLVMVPVGG